MPLRLAPELELGLSLELGLRVPWLAQGPRSGRLARRTPPISRYRRFLGLKAAGNPVGW